MERRMLYLEKEFSMIRKKVSLLESTLPNELKNYIDQYLETYLQQVGTELQESRGWVPQNEEISQDIKYNSSNVKSEVKSNARTNGKKARKIKFRNFSDADEEELDESTKKMNCKEEEKNEYKKEPEADAVDNEEEETDMMYQLEADQLLEVNLEEEEKEYETDDETDLQMDTAQQSSENEETLTNESDGGDDPTSNVSFMPTMRIGSTSVPNTSFYLPSILSNARAKASEQNNARSSVEKSPPTNISAKDRLLERIRGPFHCPMCEEQFKCASHLEKHRIKHVDDRPFKCELCDKTYKRIHHLKEHQTLSHPAKKTAVSEESGRRYRCTKCGKMFTRPSLLAAHLKTHKKERVRRYGVDQVNATAGIKTPQFQGFNFTL